MNRRRTTCHGKRRKAFAPLRVPTTPVACWDALMAPSGAVSAWADFKGFSAEGAGASRPSGNRRNGVPAVVYDGVDDKLDLKPSQRTLMALSMSSGSGLSTVAISTLITAPLTDQQILRINHSGGNAIVIMMYRTTNTGRHQVRAQSASTLLFTNLTNGRYPAGGPHLLSGEYDAGSGSISLYDTPEFAQTGTPGATPMSYSGLADFILGAGYSFCNHALHAQLIFNKALSIGERYAIQMWAWHRFGFYPG